MERSKNTICLNKIKRDDFSDLLKYSEMALEKLWDNQEDELWNEV